MGQGISCAGSQPVTAAHCLRRHSKHRVCRFLSAALGPTWAKVQSQAFLENSRQVDASGGPVGGGVDGFPWAYRLGDNGQQAPMSPSPAPRPLDPPHLLTEAQFRGSEDSKHSGFL